MAVRYEHPLGLIQEHQGYEYDGIGPQDGGKLDRAELVQRVWTHPPLKDGKGRSYTQFSGLRIFLFF